MSRFFPHIFPRFLSASCWERVAAGSASIVLLSACAATGLNASADEANARTLSPTAQLRQTPIAASSDLYYRLHLVTPETAGKLNLEMGRTAGSALQNYFFGSQNSSTVVTLSTLLGSTSLAQQLLYSETRRDNALLNASYGTPYLSPYFQGSMPLVLRFAVRHSNKSESRLGETIGQLTAASFTSGLSLLSSFATAQSQETQTKVDKAVAETFSDQLTPEVSLAIKPETTEKIDLLLRQEDGGPRVLATVLIRTTPSILAIEGDVQRFPTDPVSLLAAPINGDKQTLTQTIQQDKNLWALYEKDSFSAFCRGSAEKLAVLGLNRVDTAAVLYAYLLDSHWNRDRKLRQPQDRCSALTEPLQVTNLANRLKNLDTLQQDDRRRRQTLAEQRKAFFQRLAEVWQAHKATDWENLLADRVSLSVAGGTLPLTEGVSLTPDNPSIYFDYDAAALLAKASQFGFGAPNDAPCFQPTADAGNRQFATSCIVSSQPESALQRVEFTFDKVLEANSVSLPPQITAIRFVLKQKP